MLCGRFPCLISPCGARGNFSARAQMHCVLDLVCAVVQAMQGIMSNPDFAKMAEDIGKKMFESDPQLANMVKSMQDTDTRDRMQAKMEELKEDPELKSVIEELESGGPAAMMKCVPCLVSWRGLPGKKYVQQERVQMMRPGWSSGPFVGGIHSCGALQAWHRSYTHAIRCVSCIEVHQALPV